MKLKVSPDNMMYIYFIGTMLFAAILPWLDINMSRLPILVGGYHILYWAVFSVYAILYYRQS